MSHFSFALFSLVLEILASSQEIRPVNIMGSRLIMDVEKGESVREAILDSTGFFKLSTCHMVWQNGLFNE